MKFYTAMYIYTRRSAEPVCNCYSPYLRHCIWNVWVSVDFFFFFFFNRRANIQCCEKFRFNPTSVFAMQYQL